MLQKFNESIKSSIKIDVKEINLTQHTTHNNLIQVARACSKSVNNVPIILCIE